MKRITILKTILMMFLLQTAFAQINPDLTTFNSKVLVAAHRGDWRNAPENSLQAFDNAAKMGVDIVELDLALTKDSIVVIMHDNTIDRTTNGTGNPSKYTLAELKKFYLKSGHGQLTNHTIPTLKEAMLLLKNRVWVNLDKSYPYYKEAYAVLKETGTINQAIFKAAVDYSTLYTKYGSLLNNIVYMPVISVAKQPNALEIIKEYNLKLKPYAFEITNFDETPDILNNTKEITATGAKIWMNSLWPTLCGGHNDDKAVEENKPDETWGWLIAQGATIIQTDRPKELLEYLKGKGLHR